VHVKATQTRCRVVHVEQHLLQTPVDNEQLVCKNTMKHEEHVYLIK